MAAGKESLLECSLGEIGVNHQFGADEAKAAA